MTRPHTLVAIRRLLQGACYRALLAGADALVDLARLVGDPGMVPAARAVASPTLGAPALGASGWRRRDRRHRAVLRCLVEAVLARELEPDESAAGLAMALARELRRGEPPVAPWRPVESIRHGALRLLVEALLGRSLDPGESAVAMALALTDKVRAEHPLLARERLAREFEGVRP